MNSSGNPIFKYILFDLDDTLYPPEAGLMDAIHERILLFMTQKLEIPADDVLAQKTTYYQKYGTTLRGLMEEYGVNPTEYLEFVHDIDPRDFFGLSPPLDRMLQEIPLSKIIFTNADLAHCERVLNALNVRHHFKLIIDIHAVEYKNKPDPLAYKRALSYLGVSGEHCIIVDDMPRNLIPAKDLGMTTILVNGTGTSSAVDYKAPTIFHVGQVLKNLLPMQGLL